MANCELMSTWSPLSLPINMPVCVLLAVIAVAVVFTVEAGNARMSSTRTQDHSARGMAAADLEPSSISSHSTVGSVGKT